MEKKQVQKMKMQERGITLIALIITIIVLLILASITISALTGDNGILSNARRAKEDTEVASEKEQVKLAYMGALTEKLGDEVVASDVDTQLKQQGSKAEASGNINVHFTESDRWYKIASDGTVTGPYAEDEIPKMTLVEMFKKAQEDGCEGGESCTNPEEHLHIGDYVDYNPIATGDTGSEEKYSYESLSSKNGYTYEEKQVYSVNNDGEKVNWIVLGLSEDGNSLLITTGSPVRKDVTNNPEDDDPYFRLYGSTGYINAEDELNNISKIYGNGDYATGARSIAVEDINKLSGYDPDADESDDGSLGEYKNKVTVQGDGAGSGSATYSWSNATNGYRDGNFDTYSHRDNGFYYIENNQLKNISPTDSTTSVELESTYYYYNAYDYIDESSRIYKKFFDTDVKTYWLASRFVNLATSRVGFGARYVSNGCVDADYLFYSGGIENGDSCAVRPVVSLESGVSSNEIPILGEQEEPEWHIKLS